MHSSAGDLWPGRVVEFLSLDTMTWKQLNDTFYSQWDHEMTHLVSNIHDGFRFDAPVIIGGEYEVQDEDGFPETHQRNFVQTYTFNASKWNDWFCCIPQLKMKRSHFSAVHIELEIELVGKT